jgi:MscS family membrane protein
MEMTLEELNQFWDWFVDVWVNGLYGLDVGRYLGAALIFLGFLALRRLFTRFVSARLRALTERTRTDFDNRLTAALKAPIQFLPLVLGVFFATQHLDLAGLPGAVLLKVNRSLLAFAVFWGLFNAVEPLTFWFRRLERLFTPSLVEWLIKAMKGAFVFIGAASILEVWGIQVGPIIAGMGLLGVAVALGAQDLFKNLISGILILSERRFKRGDWIRVDGLVEGTVESIGFRSTLVRRFDYAPVHVPNAKLSDNLVINFSQMTHRRIYWKIGLRYGATVDQLREIRNGIDRYLNENDDFVKPPFAELFVRVNGFEESSIELMVYCFTRTTAWGKWLRIKEALAFRIKEIVRDAGADFALPGRSVYVEALPRGEAERMPAAGPEEEAENGSAGGSGDASPPPAAARESPFSRSPSAPAEGEGGESG